MWKHPKYYKNLRKLARNRDSHVRPISGSADSATDQAISKEQPDGVHTSVRPGPGPKQQAASVKHQAHQAASYKHQALKHKLQASSHKLQAP